VRAQPVLEQGHDAGARDRGVDEEIGGAADAHCQRPRHVDLDDFTVALELPAHHRPARKPALQTGMAEQIARVLRSSASIEIGRGRAQGKTLLTRTDRHRNHVLLQPLAIADAGVATGREHVDETFLGDDLQANVWIGGEERRNDRRQHQSRRADRDIQLEHTRWPVTQAVSHVDGGFDLGERRGEPVQKALARLGRNDTARGSVEKPDAELRLQPANRLAQAGCTEAARARAIAKAAGAGHRHECMEVSQIGFHCSDFRTTCTNCAYFRAGRQGLTEGGRNKEIDHDQCSKVRHFHARRPHG
jgi:hypothetical protein